MQSNAQAAVLFYSYTHKIYRRARRVRQRNGNGNARAFAIAAHRRTHYSLQSRTPLSYACDVVLSRLASGESARAHLQRAFAFELTRAIAFAFAYDTLCGASQQCGAAQRVKAGAGVAECPLVRPRAG